MGGGGGVTPGNCWWVYHPLLQILTLFETKKWHFPHPCSDLAYAEIMLTLLKLEHQQKDFSLRIVIRLLPFLSYSFTIETTNTFIRSYTPVAS